MMVASARASPITFNTNAAGTGFGGSSLTLDSSMGAASRSDRDWDKRHLFV